MHQEAESSFWLWCYNRHSPQTFATLGERWLWFWVCRVRRCGAVISWGLTSVKYESRCLRFLVTMCQWQCGAQGPEWQRSLCVLSYVCLCVRVCACYRNMWGPLQCGTQEEPIYCLFTTLRSLSVICIQPWVPKQHDFFFSDLPSDSRTCFKRPLILLCFRTETLDV